MQKLPAGTVLILLATDPRVRDDLPALCGKLGFLIGNITESDGCFRFRIVSNP